MVKISQQNRQQGTLGELDSMKQEIEDLTAMGIQIPDAIKLMNDPNLIRTELDKIKNEASNVANATKDIASMADKAYNMQNLEMQRMQQTGNQTAKGANTKMKSFNLKKAQSIPLTDALEPSFQETAPPTQDNVSLDKIKPQSVDEFIDVFLDQSDYLNTKSQILSLVPPEIGTTIDDILKSYYETDWSIVDDSRTAKIQKIMPVWKHISSIAKSETAQPGVIEGAEYQRVEAFVNDVNNTIKKLAENDSKNKKLSFNLLKQAQAKTTENIIMYGPEEKRFDPFLRQPISDWHIVERNKGFGLVVDDVWNIDWESIWRGTIMDKYSRPYRDSKTGKWIGGYIQKRFEVDKWIPEGNNYQLLPGQKRRPFIPEHSLTEARLEAMREKEGDKRGYKPSTEGKPFNWKTAQEQKKMTKLANLDGQYKKKYSVDIRQLANEAMQTEQTISEVATEYVDSGVFSPEDILFAIKGLDRNEFMRPFGQAPLDQPNLKMPKDLEDSFREEAIKEVEKDVSFLVGDTQRTAENKKKIKVADLPEKDRKPKGSAWLEGEPLTQILICSVCNARLSPGAIKCPNCNSTDIKNLGLQDKKKDVRGVSPQPTTQQMTISAQKTLSNRKLPRRKKIHRTEEIKMLSDPLDDNSADKEDIEDSMYNLCYDG